ncbi:MAG TPA: FG-GAP-like repeat-containing protein [Pyrinomonadaceae bacterium]|nr:FG-GAP-like repeat-containing protein [Pyrinomonadaceae bacterium]
MQSSIRPKHLAVIVLVLLPLLSTSACRRNNLPKKSSKEYNEAVRTFYVGLAALQVGDDIRADAKLAELTRLVPAEPTGWGNWGVLALRQRNFDLAAERLERARSLVPENDQVQYLIGLMESSRGHSDQATSSLRKAVEFNPKNLLAIYKLAEETERLSSDNSLVEVQGLIQKLLDAQPNNLAAQIEIARIAAKRGDSQTLQATVSKLSERSAAWPTEVQQQLTTVQSAAKGSDPAAAAIRIAFLRNVLVRVPEYRRDLASIKPPPGEEAEPFTTFLQMESPTFVPAAPDSALTFASEPVPNPSTAKWSWIGAISLDGEGLPTVAFANEHELRIGTSSYPFPGGTSSMPPGPESITPLDFNYDFKTDLVLAGAGGIRLLTQQGAGKFIDVTSQSKLPPAVLSASYTASWAADIDADGDLDIVLGAEQSEPTILRNNGDSSFAELHPFPGVSGLGDFVWADIDGDGDPDAAVIDNQGPSKVGNKIRVFANERSGQFKERDLPPGLPAVRAITVTDLDQDGIFDLIAVQVDGRIVRISDKDEGQGWTMAQVAFFDDVALYGHRDFYLHALDLDNNGSNDLLLTFSNSQLGKNAPGGFVWLSDSENKFSRLQNHTPPPGNSDAHWVGPDLVFAATDINGDGRLDLLGLTQDDLPVQAINHGAKNYHWQVIRPRAAKAVGDQRINSFGVGGEMEIRAGLLVQKQLITGPIVHFGLGEQNSADVVRIVWPNGAVRAEFETKADQTILAEQRLKGSCPFLFAYNGKEMKFVKDAVPWSSAIGLRINTLGTARVEATEEWYKIRGDQLAPRNGYYDLRITAELWETYYYDELDLMVVDHPPGTDVFVDERFVIPPAKLAITTVATPHKIARAWDDSGKDVTVVVSSLDEEYLDTFGRGRYQGVTRDHYVELDLGEDLPETGPLYLIAQGWMHPTDSSVNVAISQGKNDPARPLSLEVPDGRGGWVVTKPNLGFPAGRKKISLIDLTNLFRPGVPHRLRLRTTLEIFWDSLEWAQGISAPQLKTMRLTPDLADLHFRGFSEINQIDNSAPEIPNYDRLAGSKQIWRDLIGYYTRFGDVRELLAHIDDRYVIMNAGDEMSFRFAAQEPPPPGWVRDFVIMGDGWIKDGDYNSTFSKTVLPLPYHDKREYVTPPTTLEDEWVYKKYPDDWQKYHTRYITPQVFLRSLRTRN